MEHGPTIGLISITIVLNVLLWMSYFVLKAGSSDWGDVPQSLRSYLLVCALGSYVCVLAYVWFVATEDRGSGATWGVTACVSIYFVIQLLFIPLLRKIQEGGIPRNRMRMLMTLSAVPLGGLVVVAAHLKDTELIVLSSVATVHTIVNDAWLFSSYF